MARRRVHGARLASSVFVRSDDGCLLPNFQSVGRCVEIKNQASRLATIKALPGPQVGKTPLPWPRVAVHRRVAAHKCREAHAAAADAVGLAVCLGAFFAHFYSFAIQETITTPFVTARYGWSQRRVDTLFAGVSVLSLVTSVLVAELSNRWSDYDLLVLSLVLGFTGSLVLLDPPLWPAQLGEVRFLAGFALITVAFPLRAGVALATFSKVLGPCDQGSGWV